ncbi:hypothetical protein [Candidatus Nephthysia bennettiae]|uniref:Uncharacterized protein n=1 Tax=Candidatus Nephthysia bennettiae TaxID=3127016 RepID=A0A934KDP4_9BACT|nr:hypothetical protein [Candidatus Dormibacteraeota bacterium]MBJ7613427.1 hypothetical protein [Candidatus Dormibacteraeota bacterium]
MIGLVIAAVALVLEIIHWVNTKDSSLSFYALVLVTLAILIPVAVPYAQRRRR